MPRALAPFHILATTCASHGHCHVHHCSAAFVPLCGGRLANPIAGARTGLNSSFPARLRRKTSAITTTTTSTATTTFSMASSTSTMGGGSLPYQYQWPRPAVTVDCLVYTLDEGKPWILLIKRKNDPYKGSWALPGGFVDENEGLDAAARRELEEETGVTDRTLVQTGAYGDPGRDPRGHTVTVAFMTWAPSRSACNARAGDDAAEAEFFPVGHLPRMAFDHLKVIGDSWRRCQFRDEGAAGNEAAGGAGGVTVSDRASGETLGVYFREGSGSGFGARALGVLQPTEGCL